MKQTLFVVHIFFCAGQIMIENFVVSNQDSPDRSSKFLRIMTGQSATTLQQMTPKVWRGQVMSMAETFVSALCPLNVRLAANLAWDFRRIGFTIVDKENG